MAIVRTRAEPQDEGETKKKMKATPAFLGSLAPNNGTHWKKGKEPNGKTKQTQSKGRIRSPS
jgi:hypothetical protein